MPRKGENIYKRKDGRWEARYIRYYDGSGKAKYGYIYAKTYSEVKMELYNQLSSLAAQNNSEKRSATVYNDLLNSWLLAEKINIKESTYARYYHLIENHIRPALGHYPTGKISTQLVESFIDQQLRQGRLDNGGSLSPKTVTDILAIIKSSFDYARRDNINIICNLEKMSVKKRDREMRVFTKSEQEALINTLLQETDLYKFGVLLSLYTGIRVGELCALKWENLDLEKGVLKVRKTMQRIQDTTGDVASKTKVIITEPKSECSARDIPLPICILEVARRFSGPEESYVLSGDSGKFVEPRTMQNHFKKYITESGINDAGFHTLRHTFATMCVEAGFEIKSLSEILGHANVNITLNRYVHSSFELKRNNMDKLLLKY